MSGHEADIESFTLLLQYTLDNFPARFAKHSDASACHLRKRIARTDDDARDTLIYQQLGAWRGLAVMRAGFEGHIDCGARKERAIGVADASDSVHLGVRTAVATMPTLADDSAVGNYHSTHHRVRKSAPCTVFSELQGATHVFFVSSHS